MLGPNSVFHISKSSDPIESYAHYRIFLAVVFPVSKIICIFQTQKIGVLASLSAIKTLERSELRSSPGSFSRG